MRQRTSVSEITKADLFPASALLSNDQTTRCGQHYHRNEAVLLHFEGSVTDLLQMRTGVVHQDQSVRRNLGQETADFLPADRDVTVAEEQVDRAFNVHLEARLVPQVD